MSEKQLARHLMELHCAVLHWGNERLQHAAEDDQEAAQRDFDRQQEALVTAKSLREQLANVRVAA